MKRRSTPRYYNDTWSYLGGRWTNLTTSHSPSARFGFGLADDPADHEVVLFGGDGAHGGYLGDTWTYSAGVWTNITATVDTPPPAGFWMSMAYDPATTSVLLFGGLNQSSEYGNDTWSFHGGQWTQLFPSVLPPGRHAQEMIFDAADGEMVMFGGLGAVDYFNDTWTYSSGNWAPIGAGNHPGARIAAGMAFDSVTGKLALYGGYPGNIDYYSTWLFSGGSWTQYNLTYNPPNPSDPYGQMIYDPTDNYVFLFYEVDSMGPVMGNWALRFTAGPPPIQASLGADPASIVLGHSTNLTTVATGGTGIFTYAYSTLPVGCASKNSSSIECTPSSVGHYIVGVNVTDNASDHAAAITALVVTPVTASLTATLAADPSTVAVNESTTLTVTTSGCRRGS